MTWIELPKRGGSGGGTPGGPGTGEIQYNNSGTFGADSQFRWDQAEHALLLNGLAVRALSTTYSLVDANPTPTTITSWATTYKHTIIEYSLDRGSDTQTGIMIIANTASDAKLIDQSITTSEIADIGITFSVTISGSDISLQYITTATGFNGFLRIAARQW